MQFLNTDFLKNDEIQLILEKTIEADPAKNWLPAYHFAICNPDGVKMGVCDLRIGHNESVYYGGNIGYRVEETCRGRHYAGKACLLLFQLARRHGMEYVIITCNPDNWASRRTCEYAGGKLLEIAELPKDNNMRLEDGETEKCIYQFNLKQEGDSMDFNAFEAVHTAVSTTELDGEKVLRVVKAEKLMEFDENTYAKLTGSSFHNGVIEVDMLSRLLPDAPDFARGFIGIAFRIKEDDTAFESYYVRPTNGRMTDDPVRKAHGSQYFSYPKYTFAWFREHNITEYEAPVDIGLDEWIHLKTVVEDEHAEFFVNGKLTLAVSDLKHGGGLRGAVGFFVDIGTEAFFRNLTITATD